MSVYFIVRNGSTVEVVVDVAVVVAAVQWVAVVVAIGSWIVTGVWEWGF